MQSALTVKEAAKELGISERAMWNRIYRGDFPVRKWGKSVVILRAELDAFLDALPIRKLNTGEYRIVKVK